MIAVGSAAPDFVLPTQRGAPFRLSSWRGRANVLLLFLPAAFTPICTTELPALAALRDRFLGEAGTVPVAVTVDNAPANLAWARSCNANAVDVLSDFNPHGAVSRAYGAYLADEAMSDRATVLVGRDGVVRYAESVGKFGKRSVPALLEIARRVHGGAAPVAAASARVPLDLPVLYVTSTCPHCRAVRDFLLASGLSQRVVVREVDRDGAAMTELLALRPTGEVPLLAWRGATTLGDAPVIEVLRRAYAV